jgi:hypothetical protein
MAVSPIDWFAPPVKTLDMRRVHEAATRGPANQRAFLQALSRRAESPDDKPGR